MAHCIIDQKIINFEILKIAKELVINEYIDKRAQDHNNWLVQSDISWKTNKVNLPYPTIPPWPTEKDVINRAKILIDFVQRDVESDLPEGPVPPITIDPPPDIEVPPPPDILPVPPEEIPPEETPPEDDISLEHLQNLTDYANRINTSEKILPTVLKRIEDMRKNWFNHNQ